MKVQLTNIAVVLLTVLVMVVVTEATLRLYFFGTLTEPRFGESTLMPHPTRAYTLEPGLNGWHQKLDFSVPVNVNPQGLRGPAIGPKDDRRRILILGDSATHGSGVRVEQAIPTLLAEHLDPTKVEVINCSIPAYSSVQELQLLEEVCLAFEPDLVILAISPDNDIQTNFLGLQQLYQRKNVRAYASVKTDGNLELDLSRPPVYYEKLRYSYLANRHGGFLKRLITYRLIKKLVKSLTRRRYRDPNIFIGWPFLSEFAPEYSTADRTALDYAALWSKGWTTTKAIILRMRDVATARGTRFAMMVMATKLQGDPGYRERVAQAYPNLKFDLERINREFEKFGANAGIPVFDALSSVSAAARAGDDDLFFDIEDKHMTAKAHRLVAADLVRQIAASGLLRFD